MVSDFLSAKGNVDPLCLQAWLTRQTPLQVPEGAEIRATVFRQTDDRKVWYEWLVEVYIEVKGHMQRCGASEMHSSSKYGCLIT